MKREILSCESSTGRYFFVVCHSRHEFTIRAIDRKFLRCFDDKRYEAKNMEVARLQIAICDDEINVRSYIRKLIHKQGGEHIITEYASGEELLAEVKSENRQNIDLLFLDIAMGGTGGMEVARRIRQIQADRGEAVWGSFPLIVFVTGYPEYMPAAFSVNAFQFIVKPINEEDFQKVYTQAVQEYNFLTGKRNRAAKQITVGNGGRMQTISAGDILYIESSNHKNIIHLQNERKEYYGRIKDLEQELEQDFFRIHRGYLINLNHIDHYDRTDVYMDNGDRLALSRYKYQEFVDSHLRHISEE